MTEQTSTTKPKKASILGANALSFIQKVASGDLDAKIEQEDVTKSDVEMPEARTTTTIPRSNTESSLDKATCSLAESLSISKCNACDEPGIGLRLIAQSFEEFKTSEGARKNYLKGCKWSPDGTCIITNSDDSVLRIFDTTAEMYAAGSSDSDASQQEPQELTPSLKLVEPEIIYDYAWFPFMTPSDPLTACVFSTCKDNPVHLYDAYTGLVRCSYKGYNHLDELVSAYCIGFNSSCANMYCGYKKCIKKFDITRPGRNYEDIHTDKGQYELPGIVSCIRFSSSGIYAVGTYMRHIGIYVESTNECIFTISQAHSNGITHLMFSPDGNLLFSGARKDSYIHCWDMRNPGKILQSYERAVTTNQRIYFDIDSTFSWLCTGNNDGLLSIWPLSGDEKEQTPAESETEAADPGVRLSAHNDCVNGVSFHPTLPLIATTSGERKIEFELSSDSSGSEQDSKPEKPRLSENSLKVFRYSFTK